MAYVTGPKLSVASTVKSAATAPPTTPKTTTSVDPLYTLALEQAKAALAAEQAPVQAQQAASDAFYTQRQTDATNNAAALSALLKGIGPAIGQTYETAAQNEQLAGAGFSQGMQDALKGNTDNLNQMLSKLGSPAQLDSHATEAGDALYGIGGYYPAKALRTTGAALEGAADMLPGTALLRGQDTFKELGIQSASAHSALDAKLAEMAGKLPGDTQSNYSKLQSLALSNARFREQVKNDKFNQAYKLAQQKLSIAKYNTSIAEFNARQAMTAQKFARQMLQQDRQYQLALANLGISQKSLQLKIAANAFKQANGGYTPAKIASFNTKLDALVASGSPTMAVQGPNGTVMPTPQYQDKNGNWHDITPTTAVPSNAKTRNNNTYANFITAALKKGIPVQLAIERANTIWPETQREITPALQHISELAAEAAAQKAAHDQTTGVTLGTSPNGTAITWSAPKNLSAASKKAISGVLNLASEYLGTPYAWGGESPTGFDCSGLAQYVYAKQGISIPRTTYAQFQSGLSVPRGQLQAGDLVFFKGSDSKNGLPGHVGIYIGNGQMIQAPHTGDVVKVSSLSSFPGYMGARRYVH